MRLPTEGKCPIEENHDCRNTAIKNTNKSPSIPSGYRINYGREIALRSFCLFEWFQLLASRKIFLDDKSSFKDILGLF